MRKPSVAFPAFAIRVDKLHGRTVTPYAIGLQHPGSVRRQFDMIGRRARVEKQHILHAVNRFPDVVEGHILIRQVAVHAFFSPVRAGMGPCLEFRFHHMASSAEDRRLRPRKQFRRTQQKEKKHHAAQSYENGDIPLDLAGFPVFHIAPFFQTLVFFRQRRLTFVKEAACDAHGVHK
jgi:hypothetical protein